MEAADGQLFPAGFGLLSVVMPCYRLGPGAGDNVRAVARSLAGIPFEIVPVDDGSADGTAESLAAAAAGLGAELVRPVALSENRGKGAALQAGFAHSRGTHVLLLDGDLDIDPGGAAEFLRIMREKRADIVIGSKMHPRSKVDYPLGRRVASFVYYSIVKALVGLPVHDTQTGMKLFTREALDYAFSRMLSKRFAFDLEVLAIAHGRGFRIAEAPVTINFGVKFGCLTARNVREVMTDTLGIFYRLRLLRYYAALEPRPMPETPPLVSVVIACPGASRMLRECIAALARQEYSRFEAIVLPDSATGEAWPPFVREFATGVVRPSEKRNAGIREARGTIIAFLDDDAAPSDGWLAHAVPYFSDPDVGAVGGPAVTPRGDSFAAKLSGRVYASPLVSGAFRRRYVPVRVCDEDDLPTCNLFVRTSLLRDIGGFDVRYWPGEDTLLGLEIVHRRGMRMIYDPRVEVSHRRRALFGPHLRQIGRYAFHRGYFCRRFPETSRRVSYMIPTAFTAGLAATAALCALSALSQTVRACTAVRALRLAGLGTLAVYAAAVLLCSLPWPAGGPFRWLAAWLGTAAGIASTHVVYGVRFAAGLCSSRAPSEVRGFDHGK